MKEMKVLMKTSGNENNIMKNEIFNNEMRKKNNVNGENSDQRRNIMWKRNESENENNMNNRKEIMVMKKMK